MISYLHDMHIAQQYALWSRKTMFKEIMDHMGFKAEDSFTTIHNYIDMDAMILRKSACRTVPGNDCRHYCERKAKPGGGRVCLRRLRI